MKKILFTIVVTLVFIGCSKESTIEQLSKEVEVSLDFSFTESGSMTRAGSTVYADFYNKYIKTKQLTPKTFNLTFKNKETGATATIRGSWNKKHSFKLLTGDYEVIGTSYPYGIHSAACIDSLYLKFNEKITIMNDTESVNLTAIYDSFMTIFDKNDKSKIEFQENLEIIKEYLNSIKDFIKDNNSKYRNIYYDTKNEIDELYPKFQEAVKKYNNIKTQIENLLNQAKKIN